MRWLVVGLVCLCVSFASGCGGGGGGNASSGGTAEGSPTPQAPPPTPETPPSTPTPPAVPNAIEAAFKEGDYLDFYVRTESTSIVQGSGSSSTEDAGSFRLTLGSPQQVGGIDLLPIEVAGRTRYDHVEFAPRWKYLGSSGGKLLGSIDGQTVLTIYSPDGAAAEGFFVARDPAVPADVDAREFTGDYVKASAVGVGNAQNSGGCQTIAGIRICSDDSESASTYEYFKNGIGPVGFRLSRSSSSDGGGFYTSFSSRYSVELIRTSLTADAITFDPAPTQAAPMSIARAGALATVHGGKIYVFGRTPTTTGATDASAIEVYDPAVDAWTTIGYTPVNLGNYVVATVDDKSYFVGAGPLRVYDHLTSAWSTPNTSNPIVSGSPLSLDWKLDVWTTTGATLTGERRLALIQTLWDQTKTSYTVKTYSPTTNAWIDIGTFALSGNVTMDTMNVLGHDAIVTLGQRNPIRIDLAAKQYEQGELNAATTGRTTSAASAALDGKIHCFGGSGRNSSGNTVSYRRESDIFDVSANTWTATAKLFVGREDAAAVTLNGRIYVLGGRVRGSAATADVEVYSIAPSRP